jgi:hypothetical protein
MGKTRGYRQIALGCTLLAFAGCKKTETAADVDPFVAYELLDPGDEPRQPLRYEIADGTVTRSALSVRVAPDEKRGSTASLSGMRSLDVGYRAGPAENVEKEIRYPYEILNASAKGDPDASKKLIANIEESAAALKGVGGTVGLDDRGHYLGLRSNEKTSQVPLRLLLVIHNVGDSVTLVVLPGEPVGVGARWTIRGRRSVHGVTMVREATYTLVERADKQVVLDLEYDRYGEREVTEEPEEDGPLLVESSQLTASGRISLDLNALSSNASVSGNIDNKVLTVEDGERVRRDVHETFELKLRSKTTVASEKK